MGRIHQGHQNGGINRDFIDLRDLGDDGNGSREIRHGVVEVILNQDGWDEQADANEYLVFHKQVVVFRWRLLDEDVDGLANDEAGKEI